jgi:hypothetical protein
LLATTAHFILELEPSNSDLGPLHALARWLAIPTAVSVFHYNTPSSEDEPAEVLAIKGWSSSWIRSAFTDDNLRCLPVTLADDADVEAYVEAVGLCALQHLRFAHAVILGEAVTPAGFRRLLCAPQLPGSSLRLQQPLRHDAPQPYNLGWTEPLVLTSAHFEALLGAGPATALQALTCYISTDLGSKAVLALASVARELRVLKLGGLEEVTDVALGALCTGCPKLHTLVLLHSESFTSEGVQLMLGVSPSLQLLRLVGLTEEKHTELAEETQQMRRDLPGAGGANQWVMESLSGNHTLRWSRPAPA